jgi:hypothetical protein
MIGEEPEMEVRGVLIADSILEDQSTEGICCINYGYI